MKTTTSVDPSQAVVDIFCFTFFFFFFFLQWTSDFYRLDHFPPLFKPLPAASREREKKDAQQNGSLRHRSLQHQPPSPDRDPRRRQAHEQAPRCVSCKGERERERK